MIKKAISPPKKQNQLYDEFCINGKYGIKDKNSKILVEAVFDHIYISESDKYIIFSMDGKKAILPLSEISKL